MASDDLPPDIDDLTIPPEEQLYFRIFPDKDSITHDPISNRYRPTTSALKSRDHPLSVDLGSLCTPEQTRDRDTRFPFHVGMITAQMARNYGCRIVRDPTLPSSTLPANPAHALVFGNREDKSGGLIPKSQSRKLALESTVVLINPKAPWPPE